jgi:hypothetical protein
MTEHTDPATTALAENRQSAQPKSYPSLSRSSGIPVSTLRDRDHGRISKRERAANQQYLSPQEERSLVEYALRMSRNGYPLPIKHLRSLAWEIARRRSATLNQPTGEQQTLTPKPPGKNWPQAFYERHPDIRARRLKAIDWKRHDHTIHDKSQGMVPGHGAATSPVCNSRGKRV